MLTIKNKEKIYNQFLTISNTVGSLVWYVKSIDEAVNWNLNTKMSYPIYSIRISNAYSKEFLDLELKRDSVDKWGVWYSLSCKRNPNDVIHITHNIEKDDIKDMNKLLEWIRIAALSQKQNKNK